MTEPPQTLGVAQARWLLAATIIASGMAFLDGSVVNVALPQIGRDLEATVSGLQWTVNAYMLTLSGLVLLGGALGDRLGRRRIFLLGVVWFAVASIACGLAQDVLMLSVARALQGIGGALLTPGSLALIQALFPAERRAQAIGTWSGLSGLSGLAGPLLGGWLVDVAGWRSIFFINVPLAVAVVIITLRHVPESRHEGLDGRFDVLGAALGAVGLAGITVFLIQEGGGASLFSVVSGIAGVAAFVAFVVVEHRAGEQAMIPLGLFRSRQFSGANLATLCIYAALSANGFFLVIELQVTGGYTAFQAGLSMMPVTLLLILLSGKAGALSGRIGPRLPMTLGPLVCAAGVLLLLRVGPGMGGFGESFWLTVMPGVLVFGAGLTLLVAPLTATVLAAAPDEYTGVASGVSNAAARTAGLLAVAALPPLVGLTGDAYRDPVALDGAYQLAMWACAILLVAGGVISWLTIRNPSPVARRSGLDQ